ncbi:GspE/PulE family protein [Opitutus terrae]|uniref:Type II secretion system protein E n=1 Tax=Opitutus terrae (strain DSM 11246 / JCM 15787 / PB90-1) TaxID=452637 RepID=B1ZZ35_OPITP|nr:GspE/PulE family protein [Opitutus terrae]ACB77107.1 type II secretion system protein E [Opitutus terrae PB90-1]
MALGKIQSQIVAELTAMSRLTDEQREKIGALPGDMTGDALEKMLQDEYRITPFQLLVAKGRAFRLSPVNVARFKVLPDTFERIPQDFCQQNLVLPVGQVGDFLLVAFANPFEITLPTKIHEMTGKKVIRLLAREKDIRDKFVKSADQQPAGFDDVVEKIGEEYGVIAEAGSDDVTEESGPIIQLANRIIEDAYFAGASDIHVEPQEKEMMVRYRVDGMCSEKLRLPARVGPALVARLKIMCNLDIAERRLPQDGRIIFKQYTKKGLDLDLRVSTAPLNHGEGVVMRILDKQKTTLPLPMLGFTEENLGKYRECIRQPYGMILHCGPTGSGKSMTLYSALNEINTPDIVIRTAEDPIEYTLPGLNQMQMHRQIGLTFASALRAFLRQDPDVILVGEIRDKETADIAVEAALTGHLLISTLHTNDAPSTVARLTDMGIEPFMISSSLLCVCAQRLMRRVCKTCRVPYVPQGREDEILQKAIGWSGQIFKPNPKGCPKCNSTGYKGRVGIHELMVTNEELIEGINKQLETAEIKKIAVRGGMKTLHQDSLIKVRDGVTTMEEAIATVPPDL